MQSCAKEGEKDQNLNIDWKCQQSLIENRAYTLIGQKTNFIFHFYPFSKLKIFTNKGHVHSKIHNISIRTNFYEPSYALKEK